MAAVYVGFKLASNHDISRYTICEGRRVEVDPHGVPREYMYTVCPSHLRYCCRSELYDGERCCAGRSYYSYSQPQGRIIGSLYGTLLIILGIGLLAYFSCLKQSSSMHDMPAPPPPPPNFVTMEATHPPWMRVHPLTQCLSQNLIHTWILHHPIPLRSHRASSHLRIRVRPHRSQILLIQHLPTLF
uniref:Uncharacterized protein n=1 Tax=Echinococcus granulosus TaxID=6210 RepID=A0A068X3P7_ECHGR|nr:hypothetical protein EgrG_000731600 [Echinococcus granulosus]